MWERDYLGQAIKVVSFDLVDIGESFKEETTTQGRMAVTDWLKQILNALERKIGRLQFYLLSRSYSMYALSNNDEFAILQSQLEGTTPAFVNFQASAPRSSHGSGTTKGARRRETTTLQENAIET